MKVLFFSIPVSLHLPLHTLFTHRILESNSMDNQNLVNLFMQFLANNAPGLLTAVAPGQAPQPAAPNPAPTASQPALPPPSGQPSLPAQPAALPIQPYQSLRVAPSLLPVQLPPLPPSSSSLHLVVNQARLTHSASSQPCQPNLPRCCPRTNAVAPPSLPRAPDINSCLTLSGGQTHLRTINIVYPPQIAGLESDLYLMRFVKDTFLAKMREFGLCVLQTSPTTQLVTEHISNIVHELRNRGMDIVASDSTVLSHEDQPLSSLYLVNRDGWTFTKFVRSVQGGSDSIMANVIASVMGPESLISRIIISSNPALSAPIAAAMGDESLIDIIADYLMGSGIPCPAMFEEGRQHFPAGVDLSFIDSPNSRAQMLTWAISGTPYLLKALANIKIMLVDNNDTIYLGGRPHSR
ncbi:hypothetical protein C8F04DRAFT_1394278 [Mycena alexandri]|uniref:Uncharacterized protein n=1 Tax=Mycena alexandri TaxID=1745969 RepID=A0AAD6RZD5_9AGAR|nr:hypothetical protein C8F04DRAFT_1405188 [Mycena alexandri]KAJ7036419.1 hypothetical protein C8F04DRAFT_1394278 [Mycena alexandri]